MQNASDDRARDRVGGLPDPDKKHKFGHEKAQTKVLVYRVSIIL